MAISIGDALLKLGVDTKDLDKGMKGLGDRIKKHQKAIGIGMVALGGSILAAGAMSVRTFAQMGDEIHKMALRTDFSTEALSEFRHALSISGASLSTLEKGVKRMSGTILDAQDGLETYIRAFEHIGVEVKELDGLNPEQQFLRIAEAIAEVEDPTKRAAIAQDIFGRAGTELLPLFAAGKKGLADLREEAHKLGIVFDQEAANKAAEMTDAMTRLKESVSGAKIMIGGTIADVLTPFVDKVKDIISGISAWMKQHPGLTKVIVIGTVALGALLVVLGGLVLLMPGLIATLPLLGLALHAALGPIGLITLAVTALIAAGIALWKNWDKVQLFFKKLWENMKIIFGQAVKFLVGTVLRPFLLYIKYWIGNLVKGVAAIVRIFNKDWADAIDKVADTLQNLDKEIEAWADGLVESGERGKKALAELANTAEIERRAKELTETIKEELEERRDAELANLAELKEAAQKDHDAAIDALRKTYGVLEREDEDYQETKLDAARKATEETRKQYDRDISAARDAYSEKIKLIDAEYVARLKLLDDETAAIIAEYQRQIDAIDDQTEAEEKVAREAEREKRLLELKGAVESAKTEDEKLEAIARLKVYQARIDRERLLESRRSEKDALRDSIDEARRAAALERDRLAEELEEKKTQTQALLDETVSRLELEKVALDTALEAELIRIDNERIAFEKAEGEKLVTKLERLDKEEKELVTHYETQLSETQLHIAAMNAATAELKDREVTITTVHKDVYEEAPVPEYHEEIRPPGLQHGGIITRPMTIRAGEQAPRIPEAVIPLDRAGMYMGGKTINLYIELDGKIIARAIGQPLVDTIRVKTGIKI